MLYELGRPGSDRSVFRPKELGLHAPVKASREVSAAEPHIHQESKAVLCGHVNLEVWRGRGERAENMSTLRSDWDKAHPNRANVCLHHVDHDSGLRSHHTMPEVALISEASRMKSKPLMARSCQGMVLDRVPETVVVLAMSNWGVSAPSLNERVVRRHQEQKPGYRSPTQQTRGR